MNHYIVFSLYASLSLVPQWFKAPAALPEPATSTAPVPAVVIETPQPQRNITATLFSYSSTVGQTDASPFTTASGEQVRDGIIANNCLPFGTKVTIPELYGDKVFTVADRMALRYGCNTFDIWQTSTAAAKQFGKQVAVVEVY
jgi:3D (Asp-Asp-Asp) domain-containing protein